MWSQAPFKQSIFRMWRGAWSNGIYACKTGMSLLPTKGVTFHIKLYFWDLCLLLYRPVGRALTRSSLENEVWGSNLGPVKSNSEWPTACHRCNISLKGAVLLGRNDTDKGSANSIQASAQYSENNERFDLCILFTYCQYLQGTLHFDNLLWFVPAVKRVLLLKHSR